MLTGYRSKKDRKTRNRLCRKSLLHAKVMAQLVLAPQRRLNSPPVSTMTARASRLPLALGRHERQSGQRLSPRSHLVQRTRCRRTARSR